MRQMVLPLAMALLLFSTARVEAWTSKVEEVVSGDRLVVLAHGNEVKVRLYGIRTPALDAAGGRLAREATLSLLQGRLVSVDLYEVGKEGVVLALVSSDGRIINKELLIRGFARVDREKCRAYFCDSWRAVEEQAARRKAGLWRAEWENDPSVPFSEEEKR